MSAARAKARKMAARFGRPRRRPRRRNVFGPLGAGLISAGAYLATASGIQRAVTAALDFERAYEAVRLRTQGTVTRADFVKVRAARP